MELLNELMEANNLWQEFKLTKNDRKFIGALITFDKKCEEVRKKKKSEAATKEGECETARMEEKLLKV